MTFYVTDQNTVVLILMLLGAFFALLADMIKVKRRFLKTGKTVRFFEDLLYCILCTVLFEITVFVINYGYVRWYEFAAVVAGYTLYVLLPGDVVMWILVGAAELISRLIHLVLMPLVKLYSYISGIAVRIGQRLVRKAQSAGAKLYSAGMEKKIISMSRKGFQR